MQWTASPFGPLAAWQWGNGLRQYRDYDTDGRLADWELRNGTSLLRSELAWDSASRVSAINDPAAAANKGGYQYDSLDRLTLAQRGNPVTSTQQFDYDAVGNRATKTVDGALTNYTYPSNSNQLQALSGATSRRYVYDGAGNPTTIAGQTYTYNLANQLAAIQGGATASYAVNALGQWVSTTVSGVTTLFVYDEQGRLLGEYDGSGNLIQETVWLEDLPIATLRPTGSGYPTPIALYYVHADHLGSPRAITRPSDNAFMWALGQCRSVRGEPAERKPERTRGVQVQPAVSRPVLRCRDWDALQLLPGLRSGHREVSAERSSRIGRRFKHLWLCRFKPAEFRGSIRAQQMDHLRAVQNQD